MLRRTLDAILLLAATSIGHHLAVLTARAISAYHSRRPQHAQQAAQAIHGHDA